MAIFDAGAMHRCTSAGSVRCAVDESVRVESLETHPYTFRSFEMYVTVMTPPPP